MTGDRLYRVVHRTVTWVLKLLETLHQGIWLGLLDRSSLHRLAELEYLARKPYRDPENNLSGLKHWEQHVVEEYFDECRSILVGAVGGGRELVALHRRGLRADGFDCSPELVESSRGLLTSERIVARVAFSPPDAVPEELGNYDGIIMGWGGYMQIVGRQTRIDFLNAFRSHVRPGGPLLVSFFTRDETSRHFLWKYRIGQVVRRLRFRSEPVEIGDSLTEMFHHHFTREEIEGELREGGFEPVFFSRHGYGHAVGLARQ